MGNLINLLGLISICCLVFIGGITLGYVVDKPVQSCPVQDGEDWVINACDNCVIPDPVVCDVVTCSEKLINESIHLSKLEYELDRVINVR